MICDDGNVSSYPQARKGFFTQFLLQSTANAKGLMRILQKLKIAFEEWKPQNDQTFSIPWCYAIGKGLDRLLYELDGLHSCYVLQLGDSNMDDFDSWIGIFFGIEESAESLFLNLSRALIPCGQWPLTHYTWKETIFECCRRQQSRKRNRKEKKKVQKKLRSVTAKL